MSGKPKEPLTTEQKTQVATLSAAGWSQNKIAKTIARSRHAVKLALEKPEVQQAVHDEKAELAGIFRQKSRDVVSSISDVDIAKASLQQKSISSGVLLDKSLLLAGEPTEILGMQVQVLMDLAGAIRRQDAEADAEYQRKWDETHTLPAVAQTSPQTQIPPATRPTSHPKPSPQPEKSSQEPATRIKYSPVLPGKHEDHCPPESPLLHGLPGSRE